jgi:two-component system phosphate regulon sensor histidine kinase PhoR
MKSRPLILQILPSHLIVVLCAVIAAAWYASRAVRTFHYGETEETLVSAARLVASHLAEHDVRLDIGTVDPVCDELGRASGYRVTVILPSGKVVGDSERDPADMDDHSDRPEIREALRNGRGCSQRYSATLRMNMMYAAIPMKADGAAAVIRVSLSLASVDAEVKTLQRRIVGAGFGLAGLAVALSVLLARRVTRPLDAVRSGAEAFARGDLHSTVPLCAITEINVLSRALNRMAGQLEQRMETITRDRDERDALLSCMTECVIGVDTEGRLIEVNRAAEELLGISRKDSQGMQIVEVIRNADLQEIIRRALHADELVEGDINLFDRGLRLQAHGSVLRGASGERIGALLVLTDVTRLHVPGAATANRKAPPPSGP